MSRQRHGGGADQRRRGRAHMLAAGKVKAPGLWERLWLRRLGRADGKRGLPARGEDGCWRSALLDAEANAYEEYATRVWGGLQLGLEPSFEILGKLSDSVAARLVKIETLQAHLAAALPENIGELQRKTGEEALEESTVRSRRMRERERAAAPLREALLVEEEKLGEERDALRKLFNELEEEAKSACLVCARLGEHSRLRADLYWNAALRRHPQAQEMPVIPTLTLQRRAEEQYDALHREALARAKELLTGNSREEAV